MSEDWEAEIESLRSELADAHEHIAEQYRAIEALKSALDGIVKLTIHPEAEVVTGLAWTGASRDYFANMGAVNHELAQEIAKWARNAAGDPLIHPDAINVTEGSADAPKHAEIEP